MRKKLIKLKSEKRARLIKVEERKKKNERKKENQNEKNIK